MVKRKKLLIVVVQFVYYSIRYEKNKKKLALESVKNTKNSKTNKQTK